MLLYWLCLRHTICQIAINLTKKTLKTLEKLICIISLPRNFSNFNVLRNFAFSKTKAKPMSNNSNRLPYRKKTSSKKRAFNHQLLRHQVTIRCFFEHQWVAVFRVSGPGLTSASDKYHSTSKESRIVSMAMLCNRRHWSSSLSPEKGRERRKTVTNWGTLNLGYKSGRIADEFNTVIRWTKNGKFFAERGGEVVMAFHSQQPACKQGVPIIPNWAC